MATGSPVLGASSRASFLATGGVVFLSVAFMVVLALGVAAAASRMLELDERRTEALGARSDPVDVAGAATGAFRRFRSTLDRESRFALVYGPEVDVNERGTYRLVGAYYLYPAIAVSRPIAADAVMVFGSPPADVRRAFEEVAVVDGVWLGRRP